MEIKKMPKDNYVCDDIVIRNIHNYHLREYIDEFVKTMLYMHDDIDLSNLFRNIQTMIIKEKDLNMFALIGRNYDGCYDSCTNTITLYENEVIFHELFHMASNYFDRKNNRVFQGFLQVDLNKKNDTIGVALNEGYTEHLSRKYFKSYNGNCYLYEQFIVSKIEDIIGPFKMEKLYLNADLYGLVEELKQYVPEDEIMKFDQTLNHEFSNRKKYQDLKKEIYYFLYKLKLIKTRKDLEEHKISVNSALLKINSFIFSFSESEFPVKREESFVDTYTDTYKTYNKVMK